MKPGRPVANPEIAVDQEDDGALLFHPETGEVQLLNTTGAYLFGLLDGSRSRDDLVDCLVRQFEIEDRQTAENDVDEFLKELKDRSLAGEAA
jgi:PqqD family protein of HPr-rel-A system